MVLTYIYYLVETMKLVKSWSTTAAAARLIPQPVRTRALGGEYSTLPVRSNLRSSFLTMPMNSPVNKWNMVIRVNPGPVCLIVSAKKNFTSVLPWFACGIKPDKSENRLSQIWYKQLKIKKIVGDRWKALTHYTRNCKDFSKKMVVKIVAHI